MPRVGGRADNGGMRVLLKTILDCTPDAAWRALRDPAVFRAVSAPFTTFTAEPGGFPALWSEGEYRVRVKAFGLIPLGEQDIRLSFHERPDFLDAGDVRIVRDDGGGASGALAAVTHWRHSMAVAPLGTRTLYRDQLEISAGPLTLPLWLFYWAFWQWRAVQLRRLAPSWRSDETAA